MDATVDGILGYLSSQKESKGVSASKKGVIKDGKGKPGEVSPTLASPEKARYTAIFKLLKGILFPPEEAKRLKGTKIDKAIDVKKVTPPEEKKEKSGLPLKLLAGLGIMAAAALLFDALGPVGRFIVKAITKIKALGIIFKGIIKGITGAFKRLKASKLGQVVGNMAKGIGNLFKSIFGAFERLKESKLGQVVGKIAKGIGAFFKGIGSKILGLLGFGGDAAKGGGGLVDGFRAAGGVLKTVLGGTIKQVAPRLLKMLKFLPVIGSLVSFGFAFARFKKGETIPAIFELLSGILNLIPAGVTQIISMAIDGGLLLYDMYTAKNEKREEAGMEKISFLTWFKETIGSKLITVLKYLPGIGGIFTLGEAFGAFKSGNIGEGLKLLGSSIFSFIGGKGLGDLALKGINFLTSMFSGEKEEGAESAEKGESFFDIMKKIWKKAGEIVSEKIKALRDWALKKLDPRNWFGSDEEEKKAKEKVQGISEAEKLKKAKAAGHSSWDEYKASGWEWKADKKKDNVTADTLKITGDLANLAQQQLTVLKQINDNIRMLVEKGSMGATSIATGQNQQKTSRVFDTGFDSANNIEIQNA